MNPHGTSDESARATLKLLAHGGDPLALSPEEVRAAATAALAALERAPRVESRAERIARLRTAWPRAYEPWTFEEDERLLARVREEPRVARLAEEFGRQPNAVRARLEKHLGADWRTKIPIRDTPRRTPGTLK